MRAMRGTIPETHGMEGKDLEITCGKSEMRGRKTVQGRESRRRSECRRGRSGSVMVNMRKLRVCSILADR